MYIRMAIVMVIKLYTLRVVLRILGVQDYGLYDVIAGVVTMLQSLTGILSASTQRFYSYALGEKNEEKMRDIYNVSFNLFLVFSILIIILGETVGLWFVNSKLTIPDERIVACNILYQFTLFSFCVTMFNIPYLSSVIAHEDMKYFAIVNTLESVIMLLLVSCIELVSLDHLVLYGLVMLLIPIFSSSTYFIICKKKYSEFHRGKVQNHDLYKEILTFSGWTMFSPVASVCINQVNTILVNIFFGPIINGARGIAFQLNNALNSFCSSFLLAIRPPMIKSYAEKNYDYLNLLFNMTNKFIFFSLLMICVPVFFEMDSILGWWLMVNDSTTVLFSRFIVIYVIIMSLNNPIGFIVQATGKMKDYTIYVEFFTFLCLPVTYLLFKIGLPAYTTFVVMIVCTILSHIARMVCLKRVYPIFSYKEYIVGFALKAGLVSINVVLLGILIHYYIAAPLLRLIVLVVITVSFTIILSYFIGMNHFERVAMRQLVNDLRRK